MQAMPSLKEPAKELTKISGYKIKKAIAEIEQEREDGMKLETIIWDTPSTLKTAIVNSLKKALKAEIENIEIEHSNLSGDIHTKDSVRKDKTEE